MISNVLYSHINTMFYCEHTCMGGVIVRVFASIVDHGFESWSGQTKDYEIGICCFSAKHVALRNNNKEWLG